MDEKNPLGTNPYDEMLVKVNAAFDKAKKALDGLHIDMREKIIGSRLNVGPPVTVSATGTDLSEIVALKECNAALVAREQMVRNEANQLRQACAEMRAALQQVWDEDEMGYLTDGSSKECVKCGVVIDDSRGHKEDCIQAPIEHALSSDCGKGYIPVTGKLESLRKPVYCLGRSTIEQTADKGELLTELVDFVSASDLFNKNPYKELLTLARDCKDAAAQCMCGLITRRCEEVLAKFNTTLDQV